MMRFIDLYIDSFMMQMHRKITELRFVLLKSIFGAQKAILGLKKYSKYVKSIC